MNDGTINITITGEDEIREFLHANADAIAELYLNRDATAQIDQYLHGELEIVGCELLSAGTGITMRLYITEGFRELLAAVGA